MHNNNNSVTNKTKITFITMNMKQLMILAMMLLSVNCMAQNGQRTLPAANPIVGSWYYEQDMTLELTLATNAKKGNYVQREKDVCHGGLTVYVGVEFSMALSLKLKQKINNSEAIYSATGTNATDKPVRGTVHIKKIGKRVVVTGTNSAGKKWPFSGFTLEPTM